MFVTKSYHQSEIRRLEERIEDFKRFCDFQEKHYLAQIEDFRKLVFPQITQASQEKSLEADSVMSGSDKPYQISEEQHNKLLEQSREADLLIGGNYAEDLLQ